MPEEVIITEEEVEESLAAQKLEPPKETREVTKPLTKNSIVAKESGVLVGSTVDEQYRLAKAYFQSGLMPKGLNSPEKVMVAMQVLYELGLPPMTSIGKVCVVNGTASIFGDLPLALVLRSGKLSEIKEHLFNKEGEVIALENETDYYGASITVTRKEPNVTLTRQFTIEDAKKAGLWGKNVWASYPKRMLQMRARGHALKDLFADVLMGISILEYDHNLTIEAVESKIVNHGGTTLEDELNNKLNSEQKKLTEGNENAGSTVG